MIVTSMIIGMKMITVRFKVIEHGIPKKLIGIPIGNLAVVPDWYIYSLISKSKFFKPKLDRETALQLAEKFNCIYGDYLYIPQTWIGADVISLARYSVLEGEKIAAWHEHGHFR